MTIDSFFKKLKKYSILFVFIFGAYVASIIFMRTAFPFVEKIDFTQYGFFALFLLFVLGIVVNATILFPVPATMPILASLAGEYNILLIVMVYSAGATIGECSSYWAGRFGRQIIGGGKKDEKNKDSRITKAGAFVSKYSGFDEMRKLREGASRAAEEKTKGWLDKYGGWGIFFLSVQPVLPFDVAGLAAGSVKYNFGKFLLFTFLGRIPKYILTILLLSAGAGVF